MTAPPGRHRARPGRAHARVGTAIGLALVTAALLGGGPEWLPEAIRPPEATAPPAGEPPDGTVVVHGRAGGFGGLEDTLPSGQSAGQRPVPNWEPSPEARTGATAVAADGTVFVAGREAGGGEPAAGLAVGVYRSAEPAYTTLRLRPADAAPAGDPAAPAVSDLVAVAGGEAIAVTAGSPEPGYETEGDWPSLSILTKVDGGWGVTSQWTAADLELPDPSLGELVSLPRSGHLIVAQPDGGLLALRLAGPDRDGRFTARVTGRYQYPPVPDPVTGEPVRLWLRGLHADPTGETGGERFALIAHDADDQVGARPSPVQELSYDAEGGTITPISAPTIPGDQPDDDAYYGYSAVGYDHAGNLWAARSHGLAGGMLAVYTAAADGRAVLDRPECRFDRASPAAGYLTGGGGGPLVWGQACRPDYDLVQAKELPAIVRMVPDPAGDGVVGLALGGLLLPARAEPAAAGLNFEVGNLVDTGLALLPSETTSLLADGAFDPDGHLWTPVAAQAGGEQWWYEVDVADLFAPPPVRLPEVPGQAVTVQPGYTVTTATEQLEGSWATVDVNSRAYLGTCGSWFPNVGCHYDGVPGHGFMLAERHGFGHLAGEVSYRVEVPVAGRYQVAYRVFTFEAVTEAEIVLSAADGHDYRMPVDTDGRWETAPAPELVELPAGVHTIQLSVADGRGGWHLGWFSLQRA